MAMATACGLKPNGALDMALITTDVPCSATGLFTTNRVKAAPVIYDQEILATNASAIRAVIVNAGNANACTGPQGAASCRAMAELTAERLGCRADQVLVLSTGVIGRQLDMTKVAQGIASLTGPTAHSGAGAAARAMMTTDTHPKVASRTITVAERTVTIAGMCKGAGMIHPNMATMLAVVTTDAHAHPAQLDRALRIAANRSFNRVSVDGDTSTNDTLLLLASGASGIPVSDTPLTDGLAFDDFAATLTDVCIDLAKQIARDGEGATRLVEITVSGALDEQQAHQVANAIARSPAGQNGDPRRRPELGTDPVRCRVQRRCHRPRPTGTLVWCTRGVDPACGAWVAARRRPGGSISVAAPGPGFYHARPRAGRCPHHCLDVRFQQRVRRN
jgi:N-acetylglutamate synthase (EC 2.3.1.1)/glutamate N-acetyltransferase (EC 2.3.1.35)